MATNAKGETLLHVRPLESLEARALPGTQEAGRPFWSPDSKSLAFVAGGKLKRIDLAGGSPTSLCDAAYARGGAWNEGGVIVFGDQGSGLQRIPASGGKPLLVTRVNKEAGETFHYYPQFLPGGKQFLYLVRHGEEAEKMSIYIGSLDDKPGTPATRIVQTEFRAEYDAGSRQLLYLQGAGTLMAQRLELDPPRLTGDPATVAEGVRISLSNGYAEFSVSRNGTLFYSQGSGEERVRFGWRDRAGKLLETIGYPVKARLSFSLSPDGSRVAYFAGSGVGQTDLWVLELAGGLSRRVTLSNGSPRWSPDGKQFYYTNPGGIQRKAADGSGEEELLMKVASLDWVQSVSPDGKVLLYGNTDIMMLPLTGEGKATAYLQTKYAEGSATFSPDGRWVAYQSDESGRNEIYVQGFPERRGTLPVSAEGGRAAAWRADGKELYWAGRDGTLMAASVELQAAGVRVGRTEALFRIPVSDRLPYYQPSRDGRRFLVYEPEGTQQDRPMVVVENWAARLGR